VLREEFNRLTKEYEEALQHLASDITTGVLFERLPPMDLWKRAETDVTRLKDLTVSCKDRMLILKPEQAAATEQRFGMFFQGLTNFREILFQNSSEPLTNSRLAFELLRGAVVDGSEFLWLIKDARDNPSPLISEVLRLREIAESGGHAATDETVHEPTQPVSEGLSREIDNLRSTLDALERAVLEMRKRAVAPQADEAQPKKNDSVNHAKKEPNEQNKQRQGRKSQLSLSQFKN
jgi:hypothetical protein